MLHSKNSQVAVYRTIRQNSYLLNCSHVSRRACMTLIYMVIVKHDLLGGLVVDNVIRQNIQHRLPLRLLLLPDMKLVKNRDVSQTKLLRAKIQESIYQNLWKYAGNRDLVDKWIEERTGFAILSHRWSDDELSLQDVEKISSFSEIGIKEFIEESTYGNRTMRSVSVIDRVKHLSLRGQPCQGEEMLQNLKQLRMHIHGSAGLVKLLSFCEVAWDNGCEFAWLDTGCIDNSSSAEVEESIRSMFRWYRESKICIVHLAGSNHVSDLPFDPWFSRGWTLQELLAPKALRFYTSRWESVTDRNNDKVDDEPGRPLWKTISEISGISLDEILDFKPGLCNLRQRLGWASRRQTTRVEDMTYCLLGIFDMSLRIAYGEGRIAFFRLQEEIMKRSNDRGLFMWNGDASPYNSMLAAGPECFSDNLEPFTIDKFRPTSLLDSSLSLTNSGLQIAVALYDVQHDRVVNPVGPGWVYRMKIDGQDVQMQLKEEVKCFNLAVLGHSFSIPLVILLYGLQYGRDVLYKKVPGFSLTKVSLPYKLPSNIIVA